MDNNFNIGERIRELRQLHGLSQEQLALRADITTTYLGLVERNVKNPTIRIVEKLCQALDMSLSEFFTREEEHSKTLDLHSAQLLSQLSSRTTEEKQLALQLIRTAFKLRDLSE